MRSHQQELIDKDPDALVARVVRMSILVDPPQPLLPDGRVDSVGRIMPTGTISGTIPT